jgi:hypothetical protein
MNEEISKEERQAIYEAAKGCGFIDAGHSNRLYCTIDQLVAFAANISSATAEQIINAFNKVKK